LANTPTECLTIYDGMLFMALQLTFAGFPCPALWGYTSDTLTNLCNAIIQKENWNHNILKDPISDLLPTPTPAHPPIMFKGVKELSVVIPINNKGKADIYTDECNAIYSRLGKQL
jgi:hypothetical protein